MTESENLTRQAADQATEVAALIEHVAGWKNRAEELEARLNALRDGLNLAKGDLLANWSFGG